MPGPSLFSIAVIGLLAGVLARALVGGRRSLFASLLIGLAGAVLGAVAAGALGLPVDSLVGLSAAALAGSAALLSLVALATRRPR